MSGRQEEDAPNINNFFDMWIEHLKCKLMEEKRERIEQIEREYAPRIQELQNKLIIEKS